MKKPAPLVLILAGLTFNLGAGPIQSIRTTKANLPPPLRIHIPFAAAWETMLETIEKKGMAVAEKQQARGIVITDYLEYSSGPLTESHIAKVGDRPRLSDGDWVRVKYQYEITVLLLTERETLVTVNSNIRALKREFLGGEKWIDIASNGRLESDLLTLFGQHLFGEGFSLSESKKGFWDRSPGYVPGVDVRPRIVGPERKPPSD